MEPTEDKRRKRKRGKKLEPLKRLLLLDVIGDKDSRVIFYWTAIFLTIGTLVYHWLEGWSLLDSFYFCVISLATVGYGDLSPTTPLAKIFTVIYIINGIAILLMFFDQIRTVRSRSRLTELEQAEDSLAS